MNKTTFRGVLTTLLLFLFSFSQLQAQCPPGDVTFTTQAQLNQFILDYPGCTIFPDNVTIGGPDITDLSPLQNLTSIGGLLQISNNSALTSLSGLENLTSIGGYLYIGFNSALTSLSGLENLTSIGGFLEISNNSALTSLSGLENLTSIGGYLYIGFNSTLTSLSGLENLTSIGGDLSIGYNSALTSLSGLENINPASITALYIVSNPNLILCNLPNLCIYLSGAGLRIISGNAGSCLDETAVTAACSVPCAITGDLTFNTQAQLNAFAATYAHCTNITVSGNVSISGTDITDLSPLQNLTSIGGFLYIFNNTNLTSLSGLENLTSIGGYLQLGDNTNLTSLSGLENLTSIGGDLSIGSNSVLTSLSGLENLTSIGGYLYIGFNSALTSLSGLENINPASITALYIESNPNLILCNLINFCNYLSNPPGTHPRSITGNSGDCLNETTLLAQCFPCDEPTAFVTTHIDIQSVDLSWDPGDDETEWEVVYGTPGFDPDTDGTSVTVNSNPEHILLGLTANTSYEVYVKAVCGIDDESSWTGPLYFTTLEDCSPSNPLTVQINSTVAPNGNNNVVIFDGAAPLLGLPSSTTLSATGIPSNYTDLAYQWFWRELPSGSFQANPISSSEILVVNASGEFAREYKLIVLSNSGCIAENIISVISVDASCGNANSNAQKVQVCLLTPNGNPRTICVSANAVDALLAANPGSYVGSCNITYQTTSQTQEGNFLEIESWPNPSNDLFSILVSSTNTEEPINYIVYDIAGRFVEESTGKVGETFMVGDRYPTGVYVVKVSQGGAAKFIKLVKK